MEKQYPTSTTAIPSPRLNTGDTKDYWIKEGPYWNGVHIQPISDFYGPTREDGGPEY